MPHPASHAGQPPAPPAVPGPAGTGGQHSGKAVSGPGIGVPVSVWPHPPVPGSSPGPGPEGVPCASCAGSRAAGPDAARIIAAFSRPGELVVIPRAPDGVLVAAAAAAGRRVLAGLAGLDPGRRPLAEARRGGPGLLLEAGCAQAGQAALAVTGCGGAALPGACPAASPGAGEPADGPGVLYAACQRVLRPGGVLAVITASTPCPGGLRDDPGEAISRARAAGLVYAQHIVALHAPISGSQITPRPDAAARPEEAAGPAPAHVRIHSDLLVFTKPGGTPR